MFDLIIKGGWVIDGSGGPPFRADVAILESMIAEVGRLDDAEAVASGAVPLEAMDDSWSDAEIIKALVSIKGIGVWTAEMFLIFALNRPDVLPAGDLGVRAGLRARHGLAELPRPSECHALAEAWRPYRSIASWYLWKGADTLPGPVVAAR